LMFNLTPSDLLSVFGTPIIAIDLYKENLSN
jgi:hypothetical protein